MRKPNRALLSVRVVASRGQPLFQLACRRSRGRRAGRHGVVSHAGDELLRERQTFPDSRLTDDNPLANTVHRITGAGDVVGVNKTLGVSEAMSSRNTGVLCGMVAQPPIQETRLRVDARQTTDGATMRSPCPNDGTSPAQNQRLPVPGRPRRLSCRRGIS